MQSTGIGKAFDANCRKKPLLSVIIPVYNEVGTVARLLDRVLAVATSKQVIVVEDGSTDGTAAILAKYEEHPQVILLRHAHNRGKGAAIRTGLTHARGRFTLVQDADLEYDPADYPLVNPRFYANSILQEPQ